MNFRALPPLPRSSLFIGSVRGKAFLWGGLSSSDGLADQHIHTFSINTEKWVKEVSKGFQPPAGLHGGSCSNSGQYLYIYGGKWGIDHSGSLFQLDTSNLTWTELLSTSVDGPMPKFGCRSLVYKNILIVFGGEGPEPDSIQAESSYEGNYTNELHAFNIELETWINLADNGCRPPPCSEFSLTLMEDDLAVLFGGWLTESCSDSAFLLDLVKMNWTKVSHNEGVAWPQRRSGHTATCLGFNDPRSRLLVIGGCDHLGKALDDMWLMDPRTGEWEQVANKNKETVRRLDHGATSFLVSPDCVEILLFGGRRSWGAGSPVTDTAILRFELRQSQPSSKETWVLTNVATEAQLGTHERLDEKKKKWRSPTMYSSMIAVGSRVKELKRQLSGVTAAAESSKRELIKSNKLVEELDRKVKELKEKIATMEEAEKERKKELDETKQELENCKHHSSGTDSDWVVQREDIQMTGPQIGTGGWATVTVATFRGTQVAAKKLHNFILSSHNMKLFFREMNIAAKLRHPNLVQFIGASIEGNPVFLTELMPTSLRAQLEVDTYLQPSHVKSIGSDIAKAMNYMHLMKPDPFIHRDISSANILLQPISLVEYRAKLSDYGTVNLMHEIQTMNPGSPAYCAPEASNPQLHSPKMDIFSFGALVLEMLTGKLPTPKDRPDLLATVHHEQLLAVINRCLYKKPESRPNAKTIIILLRNEHTYSVV